MHAATFMKKAYYRGAPGFLNFLLGIKLHNISTDSLSTERYVPKLHVEKIQKKCSKACFGMVAHIFYDYH